MDTRDLEGDRLQREEAQQRVGKEDDVDIPDLQQVEHDDAEVDMVDLDMLKQRLYESVRSAQQHVEADHKNGQVGAFEFGEKGYQHPVDEGREKEHGNLEAQHTAVGEVAEEFAVVAGGHGEGTRISA